MNNINKVTSLELSKKIHDKAIEKEFELPESECFWAKSNYSGQYLLGTKPEFKLREQREFSDEPGAMAVYDYIPAYDIAELGEMLPGNIKGDIFSIQKGMLGNVYYCMMTGRDNKMEGEVKHQEEEKTFAEAMGKMFFYLLDNDLL